MTLRLKINLIVSALTLLFVGVVLMLQLRDMRESVHEEVVASNRVAAQLLNRTAWLYEAQGTPAMLAFLRGLGRVRSNDITLLDNAGRELYRSPPSPYKAGRDAPAWFARLISPEPSTQTFRFPDGQLVVRSNASRAVLDSWDEIVQLLATSAVLLAVVALVVFWLVGRSVRPFGQIVEALREVEGGRFDVRLPDIGAREAGAIATAFNRMAAWLQTHVETERRAAQAEARLSDSLELHARIDRHLEDERRLIARELHDELGQSVTAIRSMALSIAQRVEKIDAEAGAAARTIAEESSHLYDAMHGIIPRLAPLTLDRLGLADALDDLVERTRRSHPDVVVESQVALEGANPSADAALVLFRAAQEGITNALRHSGAGLVRLELRARGASLLLSVRDDGRGPPAEGPARSGHYGLRWIEERVHALGGALSFGNVAPSGALLRVELPQAAGAGS